MISESMQKALNDQLNLELYSAYVYGSMAAHFEHKNLSGFANWMQIQVQEELGHSSKFFKYLTDSGGKVVLQAIAQPPTEFASPLAALEEAYKHETKVTKAIHELMSLARKENDYATEVFLQWFVTEQVEEEAAADDIVQKLKMVGEDPRGLFMIDRQLAMRGR